jgi:hypothetical protein
MSVSNHFWHTLLLCLCSSTLSKASNFSTNVQLDVIFPQNHTTYKPVFPFPIVLALHNGSAAKRAWLEWEWNIISAAKDEPWTLISSGSYRDENNFPSFVDNNTDLDVSPLMKDTLIVSPAYELINTTVKKLKMNIRMGIIQACTKDSEPPIVGSGNMFVDKPIYFNLDSETGIVPDLAAAESYAVPIGSIRMEGWVLGMRADTGNRQSCPVLNQTLQSVQERAVQVNDTIANLVAARMLNETDCEDQTWPNVTGMLGKCPRRTSAAPNRHWAGATLVVALLFSVLSLFML